MLENLLGTANLKLSDKAEVVPSAATAVVDLIFKPVQLSLLRFGNHLLSHNSQTQIQQIDERNFDLCR